MEDLEKLKSIAVFMGFTYYGHNDPRLDTPDAHLTTKWPGAKTTRYPAGWKTNEYITNNFNNLSYLCRKHEMLAGYKYDWKWLMPVVEKIESMGFKFQICRKRVEIADDTDKQRMWLVIKSEKHKMDAIYRAVIKFIEWYNKR